MKKGIEWVYDDGGREAAGFKGRTGDCCCRAIAIAAQRPYKEVYDLINEYAKSERIGKRKRSKSNARTGVYTQTAKKVMAHYGFTWVATMKIGSGCKVHLTADELPKGRIVCSLSKHYTAVIDGVVHDTYNPDDRGFTVDAYGNDITTDRCVYGYWCKADEVEVPVRKSPEKNISLDWKFEGSTAMGYNIPLASYKAYIGKDGNGVKWLCKCSTILEQAKDGKALYRVEFDSDTDASNSDCEDSPFLRYAVVDADDYWKACRKYYHTKDVPYTQINETVAMFRFENNLTW